MKNKKTKLIIVLNTLMMLCLITFSFAWIYELSNPSGTFIKLIFGEEKNNSVKIANDDIDVSLYMGDKDNNYTLMSSTAQDSKLNQECIVVDAAPGSVMRYSLKINNKSSMDSVVSINFGGLTCDPIMLDSVYMGLFAAIGFDANYNQVAPRVDDFCINTKQEEIALNKSFTFIDRVTLPANTSDIELRFYIRIDHTAGNEIMNSKFSIDTVNFIVI